MTDVVERQEDSRPDPKPRRHAHLWQSYLWWDELMQMRKRHVLRQSSAERGKSNYDAQFEVDIMDDMHLDEMLKLAQKTMYSYAKAVGPVFDWLVSIRGIADHTAAKLLAQIDDIGKFATISKLWRFCGYAVIDGQIDRATKGEKLPYNRRLKSELYIMAENFIRQQTPLYAELYYQEKERQQRLHPEPTCSKCGAVAKRKGQSWHCTECSASGRSINFTPAHLHARAMRKTIKIFLSHLWLVWRESEGLEVSDPYVIAHMPEHEHMIAPEPIHQM